MDKLYKKFVLDSLYGLMQGSAETVERSMKRRFPMMFKGVDAKLTCVETKFKLTEKKIQLYIGVMKATIEVDGEIYSCERDFEEEHNENIKHPDFEDDLWFCESDKCHSYKKYKELLENIK
jgi:hypothetical protein